jgi:hypothetical protein
MRYIILFLLVGCLTPRKAERQLDKISEKYPTLVPDKCIENIIRTTDTLVEYDLIELEQDTIHQKEITMDTIIERVIINKRSPIKVKTQTITVYVENNKRIEELTSELHKCIQGSQEQIGKAKIYKGYTKVLGILLALMILALYLVKKK